MFTFMETRMPMLMPMPDPVRHAARVACALAACIGMAACGNDEAGNTPAPVAGVTPPGSLGADGFATVAADGTPFAVTGGAAADAAHTYTVTNRAELVAAVYGKAGADPELDVPDDTPKTILVRGTIDLNADAANQPTSPDVDLNACTASFASAAGFYAAYKVLYDPGLWIKQSLEADGKPPALPLAEPDGSPSLEGIRLCARLRQTARVTLRVGSNTSILGLGADARIVRGSVRIGDFKVLRDPPITRAPVRDANGLTVLEQDRQAVNVVIRSITFEDAYDDWPSGDPKDSLSIAAAELGVGLCAAVFDAATDTGPHQRPSRKGGRWNAEYDMIGVVNARQVWIDHSTFSDGARTDDQDPPVPEWAAPFNVREQKVQHHDGAVDITQASSQVTLSFNHVKNHDKTTLIARPRLPLQRRRRERGECPRAGSGRCCEAVRAPSRARSRRNTLSLSLSPAGVL
jgi:pectate lyase